MEEYLEKDNTLYGLCTAAAKMTSEEWGTTVGDAVIAYYGGKYVHGKLQPVLKKIYNAAAHSAAAKTLGEFRTKFKAKLKTKLDKIFTQSSKNSVNEAIAEKIAQNNTIHGEVIDEHQYAAKKKKQGVALANETVYKIPKINEDVNGIFVTAEELAEIEAEYQLFMPDGRIVDVDFAHTFGGTKRGMEFSGGHSNKILDLIEKGVLINDGSNISSRKIIPKGCSVVKWKPAGNEYLNTKSKYSSLLPKNTHAENGRLIKEAWQDTLINWSKVEAATKSAGGNISIVGKTKCGIQIEFNNLDIRQGNLESFYPHIIRAYPEIKVFSKR
jgi:hypothetical protein